MGWNLAARKRKTALTEAWKDRISASVLGGRLYKHARGELEMTATQIKAAQILLAKLIPDLGRTEISGNVNVTLTDILREAEARCAKR